MPHPGTHITIVQRLALSDPKLAAVLGNPDPNAGKTDAEGVRRMRFASLGAVGPDLFYFMADITPLLQPVEDFIVKLAGTLEAIQEIGGEVDKVQDELKKAEAVLTCGVSTILDELTGDSGVGGMAKVLLASFENLIGKLGIDAGLNAWSQFELPRQKDLPRTKWFWADYLHYVRSGDFVLKLLEKSRFDPKYKDHPNLFAFALGYLTHYVTDVVGHPYVNQIVQAPYRLYWQRHALVENFIDAYVWDRWHVNTAKTDPVTGQVIKNPATGEEPLDQVVSDKTPNAPGKGAPILHARLHDLIDCGGQGIDPVDKFLEEAADFVIEGIDKVAGLSHIELTDDEEFVLWTQYMAECIADVYGGIVHPENLGKGPAGLPKPADVNGAYGVARFFLKLMSEEGIREPEFPDVLGDIDEALQELWDGLLKDLGDIPSPPTIDTGGSFTFKSFWHALKAWAHFVYETAAAVVKAAIDLVANACNKAVGQVGRDVVKMAFYLVHKALWAIYQAIRETLVFAAYAQPTMDQVSDLKALWISPGNLPMGAYPVEEYFKDGELPQTKLLGDYEPMTEPNAQPGALVELLSLHWTAPYKAGSTPDAFIDGGLGKNDMFGFPNDKGPGGPTQVPTSRPQGPDMPHLLTLTDEELDSGGALANCSKVIKAILKQAGKGGTVLPGGMQFPNYNLDGDRAYGWPCWDVAGSKVKLRPDHLPSHQATVGAVPLD